MALPSDMPVDVPAPRGIDEPADGDSRAGGVRDVKSAVRTVALLELLSIQGGQPMRLKDLAAQLDVPRSSLYALLQTLIARGWVQCDVTGSLYRIGIRALLVGTSYLDSEPRMPTIRPVLDSVSDELGETVHLGRLDDADVVYLFTRESRYYVRPFSRVGRRLPAHCTALGKALLAERPIEYVSERLADPLPVLTPSTIAGKDDLLQDLARTRARGYATDQEENVVGIRCFGFALHYDDPPLDAISCSVPTARLDHGREEEIIAAMERARRQIESTSRSWL